MSWFIKFICIIGLLSLPFILLKVLIHMISKGKEMVLTNSCTEFVQIQNISCEKKAHDQYSYIFSVKKVGYKGEKSKKEYLDNFIKYLDDLHNDIKRDFTKLKVEDSVISNEIYDALDVTNISFLTTLNYECIEKIIYGFGDYRFEKLLNKGDD